jgi:glycyl-tRNA synthetase beta chain
VVLPWRVALDRFLSERLNTYLRGDLGYTSQEVEAARGADTVTWRTIVARLEAVRAFAALPEANSLAAANKRVANILAKVENGVEANVDLALLREPAELALSNALAATRPKSDGSFERGEFTASLQALAELKAPVDAFFDAVMVNADDPALRANRLGLLAQLHAAMNRVADLSKLAT